MDTAAPAALQKARGLIGGGNGGTGGLGVPWLQELREGSGQEDGTVRESLVQMVARVQRVSCMYDFPPSLSPSLGTDVSIPSQHRVKDPGGGRAMTSQQAPCLLPQKHQPLQPPLLGVSQP